MKNYIFEIENPQNGLTLEQTNLIRSAIQHHLHPLPIPPPKLFHDIGAVLEGTQGWASAGTQSEK